MRGSTNSSRTGSPNEDESVWTDHGSRATTPGGGDDDQSYYTQYSAGSMGLAKRSNKKLSLVTYVSLVEESSESVGAATCSDDEDRTQPPEACKVVIEDTEDDSSHVPRVEPLSNASRRSKSPSTTPVSSPRQNVSPRRGYKTFQDYKAASSNATSSDPSFDHSSSTHKTRGAASTTPCVSASTSSSSSHWRRAKPELSVITDVRDEEDSNQEEPPEMPLKIRPVAEDFTNEPEGSVSTPLDGAETRSRRRERLTRLARIRSPTRSEEQQPSPQKAPRGNETSPKAFFPEEEEMTPASTAGTNSQQQQPFMDKFLQKYQHKKQQVIGNKSPGRRRPPQSPGNSRNNMDSSLAAPVASVDPVASVTVKNPRSVEPKSPRSNNVASPSNSNKSPASMAINAAETAVLHGSRLRQERQERTPSKEGRSKDNNGSIFFSRTIGELSTVREESRGTSSGPGSVPGSMSDNSSIVTSNLQHGPPCVSQLIQNARFIGRDGDGNACVGYTQKCTSFVTGVWKSCGISGYQTESKKSLLQLELIAEQSVSSIFQGKNGGRQSPDAFRHSRELMAKTSIKDERDDERDDEKDDCKYKLLNEMRSDEATHEDLHNQPFGWNVEEAIQTLGAKVQRVVGLNEDRGRDEQSVMDDMRHLFDSFSAYYTPHHQPYYGDAVSGNESVFEYRHGTTGGNFNKEAPGSAVSAASARATIVGPVEPTTTNRGHADENDDEDHEEKFTNPASTSIYSSVVSSNKDRRGMVMELQKRRMKQARRHDEVWADKKTEDETARLRRLYLGLYGKLHGDVNVKQADEEHLQPKKNSTEIEELQEEDRFPDGRDDSFADFRAQSDTFDDDRDYAVVWAASDGSVLSPRHSFQHQCGSLIDDAMNADNHNDDNEADDDSEDEKPEETFTVSKPTIVVDTFSPVPSVAEPEPLDSLIAEHGSLIDRITLTQSHEQSDSGTCDNEKSTSTRYLDAQEYNYSADAEKSVDTNADGQLRSHPDPTVSEEGSSDCPSLERQEDTFKESENDETDADALLPSDTAATNGTATTSEMDELVTSFLDGSGAFHSIKSPSPRPSPVGMSANLRDYEGNSESSRSMVLLAEDMFHVAPSLDFQPGDDPIPEEEPLPSDEEDADQSGHPDPGDTYIQSMPDHDSMSYTTDDPTLADSTMYSGFSGSSHNPDLSLAETIVSIGGHSRSSRSRASASDLSSHGTPEPSEVPPEIAQPLGPISEYQVLYQISEEDEEAATSSDQTDGSEGVASASSFEHQNDIPFDEDVSLEDYQRRKGATRSFLVFISWRGLFMMALAYYFGFFEWLLDTSSLGLEMQSQREASFEPIESNYYQSATTSSIRAGEVDVSHSPNVLEASSDFVEKESDTVSLKNSPIVKIPIYDGITVWKGSNGEDICTSLAFAVGETVPETESEAYRRSWVLELQAMLRDY